MGHLHSFARRTCRGVAAQAAIHSLLLSALFLAVYGSTNWIASRRADVGTWAFPWERHLPFWSVMIVPYLSIDALFVAAPFLCRDHDELRVFTRRVAAAILTAGTCFVLMPLRFAFERPGVDGWLGVIFQQFTALDRPFNLFPSLHVALTVILADAYRRRTRGGLRAVITAWFVLIGASTVFTYQHHVVDVAGGLALAVLAFYFIRSEVESAPLHFRLNATSRLVLYYLAGTAAFVVAAWALWPWGGLFLWPASSLAIVCAAYAGAGPRVFAKSKSNGRLASTTWVMLWPYLLGQRASLAYYRRQCRPYDAVSPQVWIGRQLTEREAAQAAAAGVVAVVDLTPDFSETTAFTRLAYLNVPTLDLTAPDPASLERAVEFISAHAERGIVYVHCKVGYSRSVAVLIAFLLANGDARTVDEALTVIRRARPQVVIRPEILAHFADRTRESGCDTSRSVPLLRRTASCVLAVAARVFCGPPAWTTRPDPRPRVYYANHTSHLDFVVLWGSLPCDVRTRTRPVAGRDYWEKTALRRCVAHHFLNALLVDRRRPDADRDVIVRLAERSVERSARALDAGASLIVFPEGTRGPGDGIQPFKSGLYHLARARPDVEFVPVFLENMHRILPKGETIPAPLSGAVTFGPPLRLRAGESKDGFLARSRHALLEVNRSCQSLSTATSHPSLRASSLS